MQDVELLEEDGAGVPPGAPPARGEGDGLGRSRAFGLCGAFRRWWPIPLLLALVIAAATVVTDRQGQARSERLAAVPGMVRPLGTIPAVLWRASAAPEDDILSAGGAIVVVGPGRDAWRATSLDAGTGRERWSVVLAPTSPGGTQGGQVRCPHTGADVGDLLVCVATEPTSVHQDPVAATTSATSGRNHVMVYATSDGHQLGQWAFPDDIVTVARAGNDVVVATTTDDLFVDVARRDAVTGTVAWRYRSSESLVSTLQSARVDVSPQLVLMTGATSTVLRAADGAVVLSQPALDFVLIEAVDARFVTWTTPQRGIMHDATGATEFAVPVFPVPELTDDGSARDVMVLDEGRTLTGRDPATGRQLWAATTSLNPVLTVDRRLVLSGGGQVGVLDLGTGELDWSREVGSQLPWQPLSDGALVLVSVLADDGSAHLAAYGLRDGVPYWAVDLPAGVKNVSAQGGHLLVRTSEMVTALG
jgi:outer membrane protein assembly factor BamB